MRRRIPASVVAVLAAMLGTSLGAGLPAPVRAAGDAAPEKPIEPLAVERLPVAVELVRTLQLLQDRIARGSTQAHLAQRGLIAHIEERLLALEPPAWAGLATVRAGVTFGLSGGGPVVLRRMLEAGTVPEAEQPLVLGALAYLEGREKEARSHLVPIDPAQLGPGLAGYLALAQAAVLVRDAPLRAIERLDLARLIAPGTLVEEGALRREIFVLAQGGDAARFETLTLQYLRRFRHSVYAGNFRQRFAAALTRLDFDTDRARIAQLERMLAEIEPQGRRDLYLLVARAGLESGRRETAIFAAERAAGLTDPDTRASAQARLYRGAALIVAEGRFEEGLEALRGVEPTALGDADAALLDAALATAAQIREPAPAAGNPPPAPPVGAREIPEAVALTRAQEALARIDAMMDRSER